jgi:hypothetical protein
LERRRQTATAGGGEGGDAAHAGLPAALEALTCSARVMELLLEARHHIRPAVVVRCICDEDDVLSHEGEAWVGG